MTTAPPLYKRFFIDKGDERVELFRKLASSFDVRNALYPGSFVHIAPSFVIPEVVYVDMDRRIPRFFEDPAVTAYIEYRKEYAETPQIRFHHQSYEDAIDEPVESFDLLVSQYAGFVSAACKRYLKPGGLLLVNDSHGDASMANLDPDFELVSTIQRRGERFSFLDDGLDEYFVLKRPMELTVALLSERGRGFSYAKTASMYVFRKVA